MPIKLFVAMSLTLILLFALLFGILAAISYYFEFPIGFSVGLAILLVFIQWLIGPKIIWLTTNMRLISKKEFPWIWEFVKSTCKKEKIPVPKIAIARTGAPNAFVFGRTPSTSTLVLTMGLLKNLTRKEIEAVIGHELGHIKHKDCIVMTLVSAIPIIAYFLARSLVFGRVREERKGSVAILVGLGAFLVYFISNLLVLALSRLREYYADRFGAKTTKPSLLANALAKITYGLSINSELRNSEIRAFFIADPVNAVKEVKELGKEYSDFTLSKKEIESAMEWERKNPLMKFMEIFSSHPLTYKRILALKEMEK